MPSPPSISARLERLPITNYQRVIFAVIASAWFFDCVDVATMTFILSSIKKEFALATDQAGALASMSFLGMFVGAGLSGLLADRFGRCVVFRWSIMLWGLASLACAFAPSVEVLMFTRVLLGIGMAMELPVGQSLVCEYIPAKKRGTYVALLEGAWPVGFIAAGILAHFILPVWGWRGAFIAEAIPAVIVLIIRRIVPESPRWLYESGRVEEAEAVITHIENKVKAELKTDELPKPKPEPAQANSVSNKERSILLRGFFRGLLSFLGFVSGVFRFAEVAKVLGAVRDCLKGAFVLGLSSVRTEFVRISVPGQGLLVFCALGGDVIAIACGVARHNLTFLFFCPSIRTEFIGIDPDKASSKNGRSKVGSRAKK